MTLITLRSRKPSRGKTLIEVLVIVSMLSVVLAASITTLAALFRLDRQFRRDAEQTTTLARLASRLRSDAHQATSCTAGPTCVLALAGGCEIHYAADGREITRQVRRGAEVVHRDGFVLPPGAAVTFQSVAQSGGSLVRLTIQPGGPPVTGSPSVLATTIDAAIGLPRKEAKP